MIEKIMLTCKEMSWLSSKEIDTRLPLLKRIQMKMHATMCKACYRYRDQLKTIHSVIKKIAPEYDAIAMDKSEVLSDQSRARIKAFLQLNRKERSV